MGCGVAQEVPRKCEALSSNTSAMGKEGREGRREENKRQKGKEEWISLSKISSIRLLGSSTKTFLLPPHQTAFPGWSSPECQDPSVCTPGLKTN
jgi:hypothetical protein